MTDELVETPVRATSDERRANEWALVLASAGIGHRIDRWSGGWELLVGLDDLLRSREALEAYDADGPVVAAAAEEPSLFAKSLAGVWLGVGLLAFHVVTGHRRTPIEWFPAGTAIAERILQGEWWRAVTALTLHADSAHVAGNAASAGLFVTAVCRRVGPGIGLLLVLLAGFGGNLMNAAVYGAGHHSIGASTAIFGAVGMLGALQFAHRRRLAERRFPAWAAIAASVALLGMLGTGAQTDVLAHLWGFVAGGAVGAAYSWWDTPPPRWPGQVLAGAAALGLLVGSWWLALRPGL